MQIEIGADPDEVMERVCETFGVEKESLSWRRSVVDAWLLAARLLKDQTSLSGREVVRLLGLADGSGLSNLLAIAEHRLSGNWKS